MATDSVPSTVLLGDPAVRRMIEDFVRRRVPAADVDDVVQTVLLEAIASPSRPDDATELRKWLVGLARHKVVDHHRRVTREPIAEVPEMPASPEPIEAAALARWAEQKVGPSSEGRSTLGWMAREGEGDKLEQIAAEEKVPAARIRQRVSRMRRWMREQWAAELAAAALLAVIAIVLWRALKRDETPQVIVPETPTTQPTATPRDRAIVLRDEASRACAAKDWQACLNKLDEAKALDPEGDRAKEIAALRAQATDALNQRDTKNEDAPPVKPVPAPTTSQAPAPPTATPTATVRNVAPPTKEPGPKDFLKRPPTKGKPKLSPDDFKK